MPDVEKQPQEQQVEQPKESAPRHEDKLAAAVAAAYDKVQGSAEAAPAAPTGQAPAPGAAAQAPLRARDPGTGQFVREPARPLPAKPAAAPGPAGPAPAPAPAGAGLASQPPKPEDRAEAPDDKVRDLPPQSWRAPAKALWGKLAPEFAPLKAEALRMERERETVLRDSARSRRMEAEFNETVAPFRSLIEDAGHTPMQSVSELMKTAAALQTLPPWEKAVLVASIARAHGVDLDMLGTALMAAPADQPPAYAARDPRVDAMADDLRAARQLVSEVRKAQEAAQEETTTAANQELDDFIGGHPLAGDPDVQLRMARAIDLAWEDGLDLGYDGAYAGVLAVDGDLRALDQQQQQAAGAATNPRGSTASAEAAASSVRPSPVAEVPRDLRGQKLESHVAAAYDKAMAARR